MRSRWRADTHHRYIGILHQGLDSAVGSTAVGLREARRFAGIPAHARRKPRSVGCRYCAGVELGNQTKTNNSKSGCHKMLLQTGAKLRVMTSGR